MKPLSDRALQMLESPAKAYRGWRLFVICSEPSCNRRTTIEISELPDNLADLKFSEILKRLKCRQCKGWPGAAELRHHMTGEILLGDGV